GDRVGIVGFKKVFMPAAEKVMEIMADQRFGPIQDMVGFYPFGQGMPEDGERVLNERVTTNWLANGVHPLSLMMAVGGKVEAVTVHAGGKSGAACILHFANGTIGNLHLASSVAHSQPVERYLFGGKGYHVEIDNT